MGGRITILWSVLFTLSICSAGASLHNNSKIPGLSEAEQDELVANWILEADNHYKWSHEARKAFAVSAYENSTENESLRHQAMYCLARLYYNEGSYDKALALFDSLYNYGVKTNDNGLKILVKNFKGSIYRAVGDYYMAFLITDNAYQLAHTYDYPKYLSITLNNLGVIYHALENKQNADSLFNLALTKSLAVSDTPMIIESHINIGSVLYSEGKNYEAFAYLEKGLQLAQKTNDILHLANIYNKIGTLYRDSLKIKESIDYFNKALEHTRDITNAELEALILRNIGISLQIIENYNKAFGYFKTSYEISRNCGMKVLLRDNLLSLVQLSMQHGNLEESFALLADYANTNFQPANASFINIINHLNETRGNAKLYQAEHQFTHYHKSLLLKIIFVLVLLNLLLFIYFYWQYRSKKNRIKELESINQYNDRTDVTMSQKGDKPPGSITSCTLNPGGKLPGNSTGKIVYSNINNVHFDNPDFQTALSANEFEIYQLIPEDEKILREKLEQVKSGQISQYELKAKNLSGDTTWIKIENAPIIDKEQRNTDTVILITDITNQRKNEQTYNDLTANLNQKIMQLNCMYDISDISGVPGITLDEILEKTIEIIPVGLKYSHDIAVQIMYNGRIYNSRNYMDTPWFYLVPIRAQKKKLGYIKVLYLEEKPAINKDAFHFNEKLLIKNISEKLGQVLETKYMELVLRESQEKLKQVQKLAKIGNWEKDILNNTFAFSDTFFDILDISEDKRKFFGFDKFLGYAHPDDKSNVETFYNVKYKSDSRLTANLNYRVITDNGEIRHIHTIRDWVKDDNGIVVREVNTVQDITAQKVNQELKYNIDVALKTAEAKQQFLANMSHEMRTPMNGIMAMVNFLLQTKLNQEQYDYARTIKESSEGLLHILNDILDLSKIEAGKFPIRSHAFKLQSLLSRVSDLFIFLAKNKKLKLKISVDEKIPAEIVTDENRLYQVIINLVSNAVKFSNEGEIKLKVSLEQQSKNQLTIMVKISDTGPGIKDSDLDTLFSPFMQIDNNNSINEGTGLGLAISKKLVDLLGGTIGVKNNNNIGCTFYFTFTANKPRTEFIKQDVKTAKNKTVVQTPRVNLEGLKVLCVDDKKVNQKVVSLMLKQSNCVVSLASNGMEALDLMSNNQFDIILLDIVMPVMDGIATIQAIKKRFPGHPPVIALSANVMEGDKEEYLAEGMNDYISKPIDAAELCQKIAFWTRYKKNNYL